MSRVPGFRWFDSADERGATAVEYAIILLMVVIMMVGLIGTIGVRVEEMVAAFSAAV